jgi:hypothetical protein
MSPSRKALLYSAFLAVGAILIFFIYLMIGVARVEVADSNFQDTALGDCIDKYVKSSGSTTDNVARLYSIKGFR